MLSSCINTISNSIDSNLFATVEEAIQEIANGNFVIVVDDPSRENEGDLVIAAECMDESKMAFMLQHTTGIVCAPLLPSRAKELNLSLMVPKDENSEHHRTQWLISVDAKDDISTGVSAHDRAVTAQRLSSNQYGPLEFVKPGHLFPLLYEPGGVLSRPGHTEASIDLCLLAQKAPVSIISELMHSNGTMMRVPDLIQFANMYQLKLISIAQLQRYLKEKQKKEEKKEE